MTAAPGREPLRAELAAPFDAVVVEARRALQAVGFGVLTEIDVHATLAARLGPEGVRDIGPFRILGACRPPLAREALLIDPTVGTLLPCNVVVRAADDHVVVEAADPRAMVDVTGNLALAPVAAHARSLLAAAVRDVARHVDAGRFGAGAVAG